MCSINTRSNQLTTTSAAATATTASPATAAAATAAVAGHLVQTRINLLLGFCEDANEITGLLGV